MRVRGLVEYLGTDWSGWQYQPDQPTVQGELERALKIVLGEDVRVAGAGRTDAGVHASGQVIAFDVPDHVEPYRLKRSLNALTASSITIVDLVLAHDSFDPRRQALSRTYEYTIVNARPPSPFLADRSWNVHAPLDLGTLQRLAAGVLGEHDFRAFRAADCEANSVRRHVSRSEWERSGRILTYRVTANAFLKQMVRTLVGTMVDVALGRLPESTFTTLLEGGSREMAGRTAPAAGLALVHIEYPPELGEWPTTSSPAE